MDELTGGLPESEGVLQEQRASIARALEEGLQWQKASRAFGTIKSALEKVRRHPGRSHAALVLSSQCTLPASPPW